MLPGDAAEERAETGGADGPSDEEEDGELTGSRLGRKEHWDQVYAEELANLREHGDEGELWFGEDTMETMREWITQLLTERCSSRSGAVPWDAAILDVGTGNGVLPLELARLGFTNVTGSDYSAAAVQLARSVAAARGVASVRWLVDDFLRTRIPDRFDLITDKGTFDAIGLSEGAAVKQRLYVRAAASLLNPSTGLLVITSCNSTREELIDYVCRSSSSSRQGAEGCGLGALEGGDCCVANCTAVCQHGGVMESAEFEYADHVRTYPTFRFGGSEGTKVCTVAFRRLDTPQ